MSPMILANRFRLFFDGTCPDRFVVLMHDMRTAQEVVGVFRITTSTRDPAERLVALPATSLIADGVVALQVGPPAGTAIYLWHAVSKLANPAIDIQLRVTPSTPDEFDQWISTINPSLQA
jgi:hypothetical protein